MYEIIVYWNGGFDEETVFACNTEDEARMYCKDNDIWLGTDNYGEDGYYIRTPDGDEIVD